MYKELFSCANKVTVITGGCGLIGRDLVKGLGDHGAKIIVADLETAKTAGLRRSGYDFFTLDISSETSVKAVMTKVVKKYGRLDALVNCAYPRTRDWGAKLEAVRFSSWKENMNNHLGGYFLTSRVAAELMKEKGGGSIINLGSIYGVSAPDFSIYEGTDMTMPAAYSAIKAGIIGFTRYIAAYYGRYNVRANSVSPGGVFDNQAEEFTQKYCSKVPLGRMASPGDIVGAVVFLASNASSYVTGQNIIVDGGFTI
ncbi:MAG: SDR family oxidoreductase [Deltaproteobacteria bacterium]|nr:SDR family oxidoreductase [Deltaproteobacteria bacterium]